MADFSEPQSRAEAILQNILGASNVLEAAQSRKEEILLAILNNTAYNKAAQSRIEELLLCILDGTPTTIVPQSRNEEILVAKINGTAYSKDPQSRMEELLIQWLVTYEDVTASGSTVTFSDGAAGQKLVHCIADIDPVQDLNGYANPWPAGGGSNIWDEEWEVGAITDNTGENTASGVRIRSKNYIKVIPNTSYCFVLPWSKVYAYDADKNFVMMGQSNNAAPLYFPACTDDANVHPRTFTVPDGIHYLRITPTTTYGTTYKHDIAINYPASVTTYSPYSNICPITGWNAVKVNHNGTDITTALSGTIYGGTVDVVTGEETTTYGYVDLGTLDYSGSNYRFNSLTPISDALGGNHANCICSQYISNTGSANRTVDKAVSFANNGYIYIYDTSFSGDATAFKTAMSGVQLVYELATPTTVQLTAQQLTALSGTNTLYADSGDISVTYKRVAP